MSLMQVIANPLHRDTQVLLRRMPFPAQGRRVQLIDRCIRNLDNVGIWNSLDAFYGIDAHEAAAAKLNWKGNSAFDLVAVNNPTFTINRGFAGDGASSYLNTNLDHAAGGLNYSLNSCCLGLYVNGGVAAANLTRIEIGALNTRGSEVGVYRSTTPTMRVLLFTTTSSSPVVTVNSGQGLTTGAKNGSTVEEYRNGVAGTPFTLAGGVVSSANLYLGARNNNGTPDMFSDARIAMAFVGGYLNAAKQAALYQIWSEYGGAVGSL